MKRRHRKKWRPFHEARAYVHKLRVKGKSQWVSYTQGKLPERGKLLKNIPSCPSTVYRYEGWKGWGDWLGTGNVAPWLMKHRPFASARKFARRLCLKSQKEWRPYVNGKIPGKPALPKDISPSPYDVYKNKGWVSWGDWLGTGNVATHFREFRAFASAREFARSLNLHGQKEWQAYIKGRIPRKPPISRNIPHDPYDHFQKKGWKNWRDWLGNEAVRKYAKR